jgi:hypothetical protein
MSGAVGIYRRTPPPVSDANARAGVDTHLDLGVKRDEPAVNVHLASARPERIPHFSIPNTHEARGNRHFSPLSSRVDFPHLPAMLVIGLVEIGCGWHAKR